ncbi:MAG: glnR [Gammaproteobacteria bacterium]|jgi:DNA-binding transcriptional MerR regulator|nr:glnR [Gammaproteobacteria bacterium]
MKKSQQIIQNQTENENIVDDNAFLNKLIVGIGEVSEITGIPQRQLRYWQDKGIIKTYDKNCSVRRFNYPEIKKIILIKELLDEGYTLETAAQKVTKRLQLIQETFSKFKK